MNGLASNGAVVAYAKLIGASASAEFLMERSPLKKQKTPKNKTTTTKNQNPQGTSLVDRNFGSCCGRLRTSRDGNGNWALYSLLFKNMHQELKWTWLRPFPTLKGPGVTICAILQVDVKLCIVQEHKEGFPLTSTHSFSFSPGMNKISLLTSKRDESHLTVAIPFRLTEWWYGDFHSGGR